LDRIYRIVQDYRINLVNLFNLGNPV
jgi:hypothetical protein